MMQIEENGHQMGFLRKFMMENAGASVAKRLVEKFGDVKSKNVLVFAGLGNNGGDGLVIARHLAEYGSSVTVFLLGQPDNIKTEECLLNWNLLTKIPSIQLFQFIAGIPNITKSLTSELTEFVYDLNRFDIIIDGILGTGISLPPTYQPYEERNRTMREPHSSAITLINKSHNPLVVAVDVPSGLNPDTGNTLHSSLGGDTWVVGTHDRALIKERYFTGGDCVEAAMTVTFHRMKVAMPYRPDVCGEIFVEKIGIPPEAEIGVL
jgi:NAD(P)H-hydrate epimerase